ncbi:MAG: hypothetical protein WDM86_21895 [Rhizomicrobium sp.]
MATILRYIITARVIGDGADYEYRYVGDAERQAFNRYFKGIRITQIEAHVPEFERILRSVYEQVRSTGTPYLTRGPLDHEPQDSLVQYHEAAFPPLGISDAAVDHLRVFKQSTLRGHICTSIKHYLVAIVSWRDASGIRRVLGPIFYLTLIHFRHSAPPLPKFASPDAKFARAKRDIFLNITRPRSPFDGPHLSRRADQPNVNENA